MNIFTKQIMIIKSWFLSNCINFIKYIHINNINIISDFIRVDGDTRKFTEIALKQKEKELRIL